MMQQFQQSIPYNRWFYGIHAGIGFMPAFCFAAGMAVIGSQDEVMSLGQGAIDIRVCRPPEGECRQTDCFGDVQGAGISGQQEVGVLEHTSQLPQVRLARQ